MYLLRQDGLYPLSVDHTFAQMLLDNGALTPDEAAHHPQNNMLTRALGPMPSVEVDVRYYDIGPDDVFLLCSDGLHGGATFEEIRTILRESPLEPAPRALIGSALRAGGRDNISVVIASVTGGVIGTMPIVGTAKARKAIATCDLFARLTPHEIDRVQKIAFGRLFEAGESFVVEGQVCSSTYLIVEGTHSVWRASQPVGSGGVGDPLGELSLTPQVSFVTVRAETNNTVLEFPHSEFVAMLAPRGRARAPG